MRVLMIVVTLLTASVALADQKTFATPEEAVKALIDAAAANDSEALVGIFGDDFRDFLESPDKAAERVRRQEFVEMARMRKLEKDGDDTVTLVVGVELWPFPIPIVREDGRWRFDSAAGADEIINRIVGENEINAIAVCREYVIAQMEYASEDRDADDVLEYAQRLSSTSGQRDGLFWEVDEGEPLSPFGRLVASAEPYLEGASEGDPFMGYHFRVITRQGGDPPGGAYDYVINGNMIAGFALIAFPAEHGQTGIMTFMVNHRGRVYEKDLGEKTLDIARKIDTYDPDRSWRRVEQD